MHDICQRVNEALPQVADVTHGCLVYTCGGYRPGEINSGFFWYSNVMSGECGARGAFTALLAPSIKKNTTATNLVNFGPVIHEILWCICMGGEFT